MARSMLGEYIVSDIFWEEAINMACHASNRLYCHRLLKKTPYEILIGRKPNTYILECLVANATFSRKALDFASLRRNMMKRVLTWLLHLKQSL